MNRLACIINIWADSIELLPYCLNCLVNEVNEIIFVTQDVSNYGEKVEYELFSEGFLEKTFSNTVFTYVKFTPNLKLKGTQNETAKRNLGIQVAKEHGCSYYFLADADELWENFGAAKKQFFGSGKPSSVARMWTYFKLPTLRLENSESYYVPFITKLNPDTMVGNFNTGYYCDPTRKPNGTTFGDTFVIREKMHHFSYCRRNIEMKVRNSSAQANPAIHNLLKDYLNPLVGDGYFIKEYQQKLIKVDNIFGIEL